MKEYYELVYRHAQELVKLEGYCESAALLDHYRRRLSKKRENIEDINEEAYLEAADVISAQMVPEGGSECHELSELMKYVCQLGVLTRHKDPFKGMLLEDLSLSAEYHLTAMGYHFKRPICGLANTGLLNGRAVNAGRQAFPLVLMDDGIFTFSNLLAKAVANSFLINERSKDPKNYGSEPSSVEDFAKIFEAVRADVKKHIGNANRLGQLIYAYVIEGNPEAAPQYVGFRESEDFAAKLTRAIEQFMVSHEFAHCALGHVDLAKRQGSSSGRLEKTNELWNKELAADMLGFAVTQKDMILRGVHPALPIAGISVFFDALEIVERGISIFLGAVAGERARDYHPPFAVRREHLQAFFVEVYPQQRDEALKLSADLRKIVYSQWQLYEKQLEMFRNSLISISGKWVSDVDDLLDPLQSDPP